MLFNSIHFLAFFILVTGMYFMVPHKFRWFLLLFASCYFYMAFVPIYIMILWVTIVIDYFAGILLEKIRGKKKLIFLIMSLVANIGVLALFKYYNFLNDNLSEVLHIFKRENPLPYLGILLPIGLSFHTFQAMSYTIEVYRGKQKAERHFGIYALYVMFYPQLVAGPIERPQNLIHQFHEKHFFDWERFKSGMMQIAFGLFKKVVIADRLAMAVDYSYANPANQTGLGMAISTFFYAFQIYCDFSGYSDIAIGSARIMGFKLMTNFNTPYFSKSISEFWKRWHISLSTWFKDYLYIPLGGNRVSVGRAYFNLFFVFLVSGLWHGANWTFVIWGGLHGLYLMAGKLKDHLKSKYIKRQAIKGIYNKLIHIVITFFLVNVAWVFFRARNVEQAFLVLKKIFTLSPLDHIDIGLNNTEIIFSFLLIIFLMVKEKTNLIIATGSNKKFYLLITTIFLCCYLFGVFNNTQFIYFQF